MKLLKIPLAVILIGLMGLCLFLSGIGYWIAWCMDWPWRRMIGLCEKEVISHE